MENNDPILPEDELIDQPIFEEGVVVKLKDDIKLIMKKIEDENK